MESWTVILTIIGSFGAASSAQIVSHILTQKREDKKYKKECLQHLYSPAIFKSIDYIEEVSREHGARLITLKPDVDNPEDLFTQLIDIIDKNLKYAEPELINAYQEVRDLGPETNDTKDDFYREEAMYKKMNLINLFISQYLEINKALKSDKNSITEKVSTPYFFTHFYLLAKDCSPAHPIPSHEIFELYDLVEFALLPINDYTNEIKYIRKEMDIAVNTSLFKNQSRVEEVYTDAHHFLYKLAVEFSPVSEERADHWEALLDEHIRI